MKILYKLTTRSRPDKAFRSIDNIRESTVEKDPWILVTMDSNDPSCTSSGFKAALKDIPNVFTYWGESKNKIDAINRDVPKSGWDIIVATSDDIMFKPGFDAVIKNDVALMGDDCTVHYTDGFPHGLIMTVPIMTKKYYDRLGYIYNPVYTSLFCDEEAIHVGNNLKKILYSDAQILEHFHPAWNKAAWDEQYRFTDGFYLQDKAVYEKRKAENFRL